jgi:hypothetical protein
MKAEIKKKLKAEMEEETVVILRFVVLVQCS